MIYLNSCLARQLNEKGDTKRLSKILRKCIEEYAEN